MNAYFETNSMRIHSIGAKSPRDIGFGDRFISFVCSIIAMVTCPVAIKIEKATACSLLILSFFFVVGCIESQTMTMFGGVMLCGIIAIIETLTLKSLFKKINLSVDK